MIIDTFKELLDDILIFTIRYFQNFPLGPSYLWWKFNFHCFNCNYPNVNMWGSLKLNLKSLRKVDEHTRVRMILSISANISKKFWVHLELKLNFLLTLWKLHADAFNVSRQCWSSYDFYDIIRNCFFLTSSFRSISVTFVPFNRPDVVVMRCERRKYFLIDFFFFTHT